MTAINLLVRDNGLYVDSPQITQSFIDELKSTLNELGVTEFDETKFVELVHHAESKVVRVTNSLPEKHDAGVMFELSQENTHNVIAKIIPQCSGAPLSDADVIEQLESNGFPDVTPDTAAIEKAIARQENETETYSFIVGTRELPEIEISISPDDMEAKITVNKTNDNQRLYEDDVLMKLEEAGIVMGINEITIRQLIKEQSCPNPKTIAQGTLPIDGEPGSLIFHFDAYKKKQGPQIDAMDRADFHKLGIYENVKKGDVLCELIPAGKGTPGIGVTGSNIAANPGNEPTMTCGDNTIIDPKTPLHLIANSDGIPSYKDGRIFIEPVLKINVDVGLKTGDIDFIGDIHVNGMVNDGFKISAKGDIFINETCESVYVVAEGDIFIKYGIRSNDRSYVKAAGTVEASFLDGVTLEAGGEVVIAEYAYHCDVSSGASIKVLGKKGYIAGGQITACGVILVNQLGSFSAPKTEVRINPTQKEEIELTDIQIDRMAKWVDKLNEIQIEINKIIEMPGKESDNNAHHSIEELESRKTEVLENIKSIDPGFIDPIILSQQFIAVTGTVHPNVHIQIDRYKMSVMNELSAVKFIVSDNQIVVEPFDSFDIKKSA